MKTAKIDGKLIDLEVYKTMRDVFQLNHKDALEQAEVLSIDPMEASALFRTTTLPSD